MIPVVLLLHIYIYINICAYTHGPIIVLLDSIGMGCHKFRNLPYVQVAITVGILGFQPVWNYSKPSMMLPIPVICNNEIL